MPILGSFGAAGTKGFGFTTGSVDPIDVDYLIVAAGGGAGPGGGGGGGMRTSYPGGTKITLERAVNTITVGAGVTSSACGGAGGCSTAGDITSAGGGKGAGAFPYASNPRALSRDGGAGGSGGTCGQQQPNGVGQGNTPPVSPPQGANGGTKTYIPGGGGGGGGASGTTGTNGQALPFPGNPPFDGLGNGGPGGPGTANSITGSSVTYAGGGGGFAYWPGYQGGTGGSGGGGKGSNHPNQGPDAGQISQAGTDGLGGGGGGSGTNRGGNGVVVLRYPTACASRVTVAPGCNTTATTGSCTYATFNVTGTLSLS